MRHAAGVLGAVFAASLICSSGAARATDIWVHVRTVDRKRGVVRADVCTRAEFLKDCSYHGSAPAHRGEVVVVVRGVPPGLYAATAYHDVNNDGQVDQDGLGMPKEGVGFSRDPMLLLGPPGFDDCAVRVAGRRVRVDIALKFEP